MFLCYFHKYQFYPLQKQNSKGPLEQDWVIVPFTVFSQSFKNIKNCGCKEEEDNDDDDDDDYGNNNKNNVKDTYRKKHSQIKLKHLQKVWIWKLG